MSKKPSCYGRIMETGVVPETECKKCKLMEDCIKEYDEIAYSMYADEEEEEYPDEDEDFEETEYDIDDTEYFEDEDEEG
jgi:hypothetical protein